MPLKSDRNRHYYYDYIRIIAIIMVLYNHTPAYNAIRLISPSSLKFYIVSLMSIICKCGSPLFFMVSGSLLLGKDETIEYILSHRVRRLMFVMLICSLCVSYPNFTPVSLFDSLFFGLNWFLYSYLGYLLMLPILRLIATCMSESDIMHFFVISSLLYTISGVFAYFGKQAPFLNSMPLYNAGWASNCWQLLFPLLGYFFDQRKNNNSTGIHLCSLLSLLIGAMLVTCDIKFHEGTNLEMLRQHFILFPSCSLFLAIKTIDQPTDIYILQRIKDLFSLISRATFGVFIIETHTLFSKYIYDCLISILKIGIIYKSILAVFLELFIYAALTLMLKCIPDIRKIL